MFQRIILAFVGVLFVAGSAASAEDQKPLTEDQAKRFVASLESLDRFRSELDTEGKIDNINIETKPKAGEPFAPYSSAVSVLKEKYPADHARLSNTVKPHGFSPKEWGDTGDRVMIAYMAIKMQDEDPRTTAMMETMDASMLSMMPPEMREQLESTFAMMETVKNAPEADKKVVATVKDDLEAYMEKSAEEG